MSIRVAVVGGGPTGLAAAILLRQAGVAVSLFEQHDSTCVLPQAHQINGRSGEILAQMGVYDTLEALAPGDDLTRHVVWTESLAGASFGGIEWSEWNPALSPCRALNIGQDVVERVLAARLSDLKAGGGFGHRVVGISSTEPSVLVTVERPDGSTGDDEFDYVLACDGASSGIRRSLGIEMAGPPSLAKFVTTYFRAPLMRYLGEKPGPLRILAGKDVWGSLIGYDMDSTWAFMCALPDGVSATEYTDDVMREFILRVVGDRDVDVELMGTTTWNMSAQVATRFREGRVFLLGDAAHRFPPTGGLGLNTGLQDAHNIAWKLGLVDRGLATDAILDTYETERQPVAQRNCDQSVANAIAMGGIDQVLGASALAPLPPSVAALPVHTEPAASVQDAQEAFDVLRRGIDFDSIDFGYTYGEPIASTDRFVPAARVGGLLPAVSFDADSGVTTLLDAYDKSIPTLVASHGESPWIARAQAAADEVGVPIAVVVVAAFGDANVATWRAAMGGGADAVLVRPDGHAAWLAEDGTEGLRSALEAMSGVAAVR